MGKKNKLIMIVDDEPRIRDILLRILKQEGYKVITAPDGETALRLIEETKPDVILLDLMMAGIDGREVGHKVREFYPKIKVIYLTAIPKPSDQIELKKFRCEPDAFISKPATSQQIISMLSKVLQSNHQ